MAIDKEQYFFDNIMNFDLNTYLPDDLLVKIDRASMHNSLEIRSPFLDHKVKNFAQNIPTNQKIANGKGKVILRDLLSDLIPKKLIIEEKKGFLVPLRPWLKGELYEWASKFFKRDIIESSQIFEYDEIISEWKFFNSNKIINDYKLWDYVIFQDWYNKNF